MFTPKIDTIILVDTKPKTKRRYIDKLTRVSKHDRLLFAYYFARKYREAKMSLSEYAEVRKVDKNFARIIVDLGEIVNTLYDVE